MNMKIETKLSNMTILELMQLHKYTGVDFVLEDGKLAIEKEKEKTE